MSEPFLGEVRAFGFTYAPRGWARCDGQLVAINQNQALFALLGTVYGGNGVTTFALPNLRGRVPVHVGNGVTLGQSAGEEAHTLTSTEMPMHTHVVSATPADAAKPNPAGLAWATASAKPFAKGPVDTTLNPAAMGNAGGSQAHANMQPYTVLNYCIAMAGIFPSRN